MYAQLSDPSEAALFFVLRGRFSGEGTWKEGGERAATHIIRTPLTRCTPGGSLGGAKAPCQLRVSRPPPFFVTSSDSRMVGSYPAMEKVGKLVWQLVHAEPVLLDRVERGILGKTQKQPRQCRLDR